MNKHIIIAFREDEPDRHCVLTSDRQEYVIGRTPDADLPLPDTTVSRRHATLRTAEDTVTVEDAESTNGVFVNGEKVTRSALREGDFLTIGAYTLVMRSFGEAELGNVAPQVQTLCISYDTAKGIPRALFEEHDSKYYPALYRVVLMLGEQRPYDETLRMTLSLMLEHLPATRAVIVIREDSFSPPRIAASVSRNGSEDDVFLSKTFTDHVLRTRTAILTDDAQVDPRFSGSNTVLHRGIGAVICAPLCGVQDAVGVLYVDAATDTFCFGKEELEFVSAVANVTGMAVENRINGERLLRNERLAAMGQAIAGICHDVRNVLTGVKLGSENLQAACDKQDLKKIARATQIVLKSANHVDAYLTHLLVFAKETDIVRGPTYVNGVIEDVVEVLRHRAAEKHVELTIEGGRFEPANLDGTQIQRVLMNIITNAIDACPNSGGKVTVTSGRKADALIVEIHDTGIGISPKDIARLSEPFFTTKGRSGTGLGLAISHRIVEQHGGKIVVASEPGKGSVFTLSIPGCFETAPPRGATPRPQTVRIAFGTCPFCGHTWTRGEDFLVDKAVTVVGCDVNVDEPESGQFLFGHRCGAVIPIRAGVFFHLYDDTSAPTHLANTDVCPRYCMLKTNLAPCTEPCDCARVRAILQILRKWPKK